MSLTGRFDSINFVVVFASMTVSIVVMVVITILAVGALVVQYVVPFFTFLYIVHIL
jgi:hypothetical protein